MLPISFTAFLVLWLAFLGATVGSFLNVVVYRLPLGLSLVHPPSRCPRCLHAIRWYDNIPVLGWLWLRGRCRDCGEPIAARYPLVEALTAAMFLLLAWSDGMFDVWTDAFVTVRSEVTTEWLLIRSVSHLLQLGLLCTLWTAGLMQYDGQRPPARLLLCMAVVLGLGQLGLTTLVQSAPWFGNPVWPLLSGIATAGLAMVATYFWTWDESERVDRRWTFVELAGMCGLVVPVNEMLLVFAWAVVVGLLAVFIRRRSNYPLLCLLVGLLIHLTLSKYYLPLLTWLIPPYYVWLYLVWFSLLLMLMTEACVVIRRRAQCAAVEERVPESVEAVSAFGEDDPLA